MSFSQKIGLLFSIWTGVLPVFGDVAESAVLVLDTRFSSSELSQPFLCSTRQTDRQVSDVFVCDLRPVARSFGLFIVDTMAVPVDTDGDGLPNIWEMRYFGGTTLAVPSEDMDSDGADNYAEYIAGTLPTDSRSLFVVQLDGLNVAWQSIQNRSYTLQSTPDLMAPFSDVPNQTDLLGTGETMYFPYQATDSSNAFYRVVIRLY